MESANVYLIIKSIHVIGIISWMAGLLYFYRLFIYHFEYGKKDPNIHQLLSLMEKRLFKFITVPAMLVAVIAGLFMIHMNPLLISAKWFQVKLVGAFFMITVTFHGITPLRKFHNKDFDRYSSRGLRIMNEIPTLLMILIVIMVVLRPF